MPLFLSGSQMVFWPHQGWGLEVDNWDRLAPEASQMFPLLPLAWGWEQGRGQAGRRI